MTQQWLEVCRRNDLQDGDILRFDHEGKSYAIHCCGEEVFATAGLCTHEQVHLADGLLMDYVIECPKHNGRFDVRDGRALSPPVCINLKTYPVEVRNGMVRMALAD